MPNLTRRSLLLGSVATAGLAAVGLAARGQSGAALGVSSSAVLTAEAARQRPGQRVVTARLEPRATTIDLGGRTVQTWAYGDSLPGPLLRAKAGDLMRVTVANSLPAETSVHWHGLALRNDMDGVPGVTQAPIAKGATFQYEFTAPHPGTYFYHPHSGVQLDRGLYGALVVDDPDEPGRYDAEWVVVLDDWVDGTGRTPDEVLAAMKAVPAPAGGGMAGMGGMDHGTMPQTQSSVLGGAGDVTYPHYLLNGRMPSSPVTLTGKPGQRVRIRIVNAGSDTAFRLALGGHQLTVTHSDGFPVKPAATGALILGMGERFDVMVTLGDGAFPLVASAEGKQGQALAIVRTGKGPAPAAGVVPAELNGPVLLGTDLAAADQVVLPNRAADTTHDLLLAGSMAPYQWTINAKTFPDGPPLEVRQGQRVRLRLQNGSMMFHPMHVHGHTFALRAGGARKDTVIVRPMQTVEVDFQADNPGQWVTHCHNIYHAEAGMMTLLSYRA